ncbi:hypothetical protein DUI87_28763 [Hirundo rustica rustica]|uniref:Uncharacterized protein n=1 Tax=Hirundo rustica rustica TaxID=333673 RepID=A0A3M0J1H0_HIRRU|nr:hypothetical protein DUI87_28763 [Hirundo rustica rustica]
MARRRRPLLLLPLPPPVPGLLLALGPVLLGAAAAFNLDRTFPVLKEGPAGALFGFSVALHRDTERSL